MLNADAQYRLSTEEMKVQWAAGKMRKGKGATVEKRTSPRHGYGPGTWITMLMHMSFTATSGYGDQAHGRE